MNRHRFWLILLCMLIVEWLIGASLIYFGNRAVLSSWRDSSMTELFAGPAELSLSDAVHHGLGTVIGPIGLPVMMISMTRPATRVELTSCARQRTLLNTLSRLYIHDRCAPCDIANPPSLPKSVQIVSFIFSLIATPFSLIIAWFLARKKTAQIVQ